MSRAISQPLRRTHFNKPLIEEALAYLPAALDHPTTVAFKAYLVKHLPQSATSTRVRYAEYIAERFSMNGQMNLQLAAAIKRFGGTRVGREILCFEMLRAIPVFHDASSLWLSEQPNTGSDRLHLIDFLTSRLSVGDIAEVASVLITAWRKLGKIRLLKRTEVLPAWASPPVEAFLYALSVLFPDRTMVRVDVLAGMPLVRAMLWPRAGLEPLLQQALQLGHLSKISELDQYHQFTLADSGADRLERLLTSPIAPAGDHAGVTA